VLDQYPDAPRVFILRLRRVPLIDASGVTALEQFADRCRRRGTSLVLSGVQPQPLTILQQMHFDQRPDVLGFAADFDAALVLAERLQMGAPR
jgi:SulP family sulfate permease